MHDRFIVVGVPVRLGSLSGGRFDLAPAAIREMLSRYSTYDVESGLDVRRLEVDDRGDLPVADVHPGRDPDGLALMEMHGPMIASETTVFIGGDNSITHPGVHALQAPLERTALLTLDAHHDVRDLKGGLNNGNPVRALLEDGLPGKNVAQIGIQGFANSADYAKVATDAGIHVVTAEEVRGGGIKPVMREALAKLEQVSDEIYVDVDMDVLDRAFAPASPGSRPGGLTPMEVRQALRLCGAHAKVRAMDVVEVDPTRDVAEATVMAAASFV
ncbi:MAG: arginase family protein, partial [Actinomycetota bacterium]